MRYIGFDDKTKQFYALKTRPGNQSKPKNLKKIYVRMKKTLERNPGTGLTEVQKQYVSEFEKYEDKQKRYEQWIKKCDEFIKNNSADKTLTKKIEDCKKYKILLQEKKKKAFPLLNLGIDIAHGVSISVIIKEFVKILNNPTKNRIKNFMNFVNDTLSTESSSDDKGRKQIKVVLENSKENYEKEYYEIDMEDFLDEASRVIDKINAATRNLKPGDASQNRKISDLYDGFFLRCIADKKIGKQAKHSKTILLSFNKTRKNYGPLTETTPDGTGVQLSSSFSPGTGLKILSDSESSSSSNYKIHKTKTYQKSLSKSSSQK